MGAQGLGGLTTVLDVKVLDYPSHAVMKPVAIVPNCAATRHIEFPFDGSGPARFEAPSLENWPRIALDLGAGARRVAFPDLGMEAIQEFEVKDMPVIVAVDTGGNAVHESGPREWRAKIGKIPVTLA